MTQQRGSGLGARRPGVGIFELLFLGSVLVVVPGVVLAARRPKE